MPCSLPYGLNSTLILPLEREQLLGYFVAEKSAFDVRKAVQAALDEPLEYPPLTQAVVAGDRVVLVVDRYVPHIHEAAASIVERLTQCGITLDAVTLLYSDAAAAAVPLPLRMPQTVPPGGKLPAGVNIEIHNPEDRTRLSYLGNTAAGKPIYINRTLGEADFVIPISSPRGTVSWHYRGPLGAIYPLFSDREGQKRYRNPALLHSTGETAERAQVEVDAVGWQSGAQFAVQIIPGSGDEAAAVVAGEMKAVRRRSETMFNERHRHSPTSRAQVVVAALHGATAQTWEQLAVVLEAALAVVEEGGAIALCTDLAEPLSPALELLSRVGDDRDDAVAQIRKERPIDTFPALQLVEAQRRARIYLLSKLDTATVEDLGMTPIADPAEVGRLATRRGKCLVVGDAQYTRFDPIAD